MPSNEIEARVEGSAITDPKEQAKIEKSIKGKKETAPSFAEQSGTFVEWQRVRDQLGQPFDVLNIPYRKLQQMSRDPMLRFGMHYIQTPHVRANFHFEAIDNDGPNPQVAGFFDSAWRPQHGNFMMNALQSLRWGNQPMAKRFAVGNPGGVWRDETEADPEKQFKPVWEEGSVEPVVWKTFVPLEPNRCQPLWNNSSGEFEGIAYTVPTSDIKLTGNVKPTREIDIYHALWITHERYSSNGSIYGYPRLGYAFRYWWSYWYAWANIDRAIERMAVPPMIAYHPEGEWTDPDNPDESRPYFEIALDAAERLRSNAIAAVPSTLSSAGLEERGSQKREWEFAFLEVDNPPIEQMIAFAEYCDTMKLRSLWIPEDALVGGESGSSQRNVMSQAAETFVESQQNLWVELTDYLNKYVFPQLAVVNFPEFVANGGKIRIVGHGFAKDDIDLLKQLVQVIGQSNPMALGVNIRESLERLNIPMLSPQEQAQQTQAALNQAATAQPPVVNGVTTPGIAPGSTNGGSVPGITSNTTQPNTGASVTGFEDGPLNFSESVIYYRPAESIVLSDSEDFLTSLPTSVHYSDKTMRALTLQLRKLWKGHLRELFPDLARHVNSTELQLADQPAKRKRVPTKKDAEKEANRILQEWNVSSTRLKNLGLSSRNIMMKMMQRASKLGDKGANLGVKLDDAIYDEWLDSQVGRLLRSVHETVVSDVRSFLVNELREGNDAKTIAKNLTDHFADMSSTKADTIARSEARDAFNAGTLIVGETAELKYVRASDGIEFDERCKERNGKLMTIKQAWREMSPSRTHPRCQLGFELIARANFSVKNVTTFPKDGPDDEETYAYFDSDTSTAYILKDTENEPAERWLGALIDQLLKEGYREPVEA